MDTAAAVIGDLVEKNIVRLDSIDSAIPEGYYMIASRTGCDDNDGDGYISQFEFADYHFMRLDNGIWSHKPGQQPIIVCDPGYSPENAIWPIGDTGYGYDSAIVYFAVRSGW